MRRDYACWVWVVVLSAGLVGCTASDGDNTLPPGSGSGGGGGDGTVPVTTDTSQNGGVTTAPTGVGFVGQHGRLQVSGAKIVDQNGQPIAIHGASLFWSNWGGRFFDAEVVKYVADNWRIDVIRAPLGISNVDENQVYYPSYDAAGQQEQKEMIRTVVDAAIANGLYVIVDWHDHHADLFVNQAKAFFQEMASQYGAYPNVIWEIWNEPLDHTWDEIAAYANQIIPVIRQYSQNLILVGTPNYSLMVSRVVGKPLSDSNVAYVQHFYVGLHDNLVQPHYQKAKEAGLPVFISEWGLNPAGTGAYVGDSYRNAVDDSKVRPFINWMDSEGLSWVTWAINNKNEGSAWIVPTPSDPVHWAIPGDLTSTGQYMYNVLRAYHP